MGGAYEGDVYRNALFENPTQGQNNWLKIRLQGTESNRMGIGATARLVITENGQPREIYRQMNTGGSFGSNPLRLEVGLGQATIVDTLEITWPVSGQKQIFTDLEVNQFIKITEGGEAVEPLQLTPFSFKRMQHEHPMM